MLKKLFINKLTAPFLVKIALRAHTFLYKVLSVLAITANNGVHPKHYLIKHKEWFVEHIKPDWVVADIGSNTGMMVTKMAEKANYVYGIEIDPRLDAEARKTNTGANIEYVLADATTYDYTQLKPIDCITLSNVLEHIDDRVGFLKKIIATVNWKQNKNILIRVPMLDRDWIPLYKKSLGLEYRLDLTHFTEYTHASFEKEMHDAGVTIISSVAQFGEIYAICRG